MLETIIERFKAKTPEFWVKVRNLMLVVTAVSFGVGELSGSLLEVRELIPDLLVKLAEYGKVVGVTGVFLSQLTKEDSKEEI